MARSYSTVLDEELLTGDMYHSRLKVPQLDESEALGTW